MGSLYRMMEPPHVGYRTDLCQRLSDDDRPTCCALFTPLDSVTASPARPGSSANRRIGSSFSPLTPVSPPLGADMQVGLPHNLTRRLETVCSCLLLDSFTAVEIAEAFWGSELDYDETTKIWERLTVLSDPAIPLTVRARGP